jgi:hypothetical protein
MTPIKAAAQPGSIPVSALQFLTAERFAELDFDHDGCCTFKEFLFAFVRWVGLDESDDEDAAAPSAAAASRSHGEAFPLRIGSTGRMRTGSGARATPRP